MNKAECDNEDDNDTPPGGTGLFRALLLVVDLTTKVVGENETTMISVGQNGNAQKRYNSGQCQLLLNGDVFKSCMVETDWSNDEIRPSYDGN